MMKLLLVALISTMFLGCTRDSATVNIGYQLMANPWKLLIASNQLSELKEKKIKFTKFSSGAKVINAMASGDIDIAISGSTSIASGLSQGLKAKVIWIMETIGDAEALVVKKSVKNLFDLKGKKIGVPFGSTTHFHLMIALKSVGLSAADVDVLNLSPPAIVSAWKKGDIDAAFVWAPALEEIKKSGRVILSSKDLAKNGDLTFDGIIARSEFLQKEPVFTKEFINRLNTLHMDYNKAPWSLESAEIKTIASFVGSTPKDVLAALEGYEFPTGDAQSAETISSALLKTSLFLKGEGKISKSLESFRDSVQLSF